MANRIERILRDMMKRDAVEQENAALAERDLRERLTADAATLPPVAGGRVQFTGEEMAIISLCVGLGASIMMGDRPQIKAGTAILVQERQTIAPLLTRIIQTLMEADGEAPFLPEDVE